jgi:hypothetical protein
MTVQPKPRRRHRRIGEKPRPPQRVTTMMNSQGSGTRLHRWRVEPTCGLARGHLAVGISPILRSSSSTFLRPFAPDPLQALPRSYGRSDSCSRRLGRAGIIVRRPPPRLLGVQVSRFHAPDLPTIPSPTTCGRSVSPRHVTCRWTRPRLLPHEVILNGNSGLRPSLADSPHHAGRIEFLCVRTGPSPPAALHPVSPRRSCRLITSYVNSERTSTPLIVCALRRTRAGL